MDRYGNNLGDMILRPKHWVYLYQTWHIMTCCKRWEDESRLNHKVYFHQTWYLCDPMKRWWILFILRLEIKGQGYYKQVREYLVNMTVIKLLCVFKLNLVDISMMRGWTLLVFKIKSKGHNGQIWKYLCKHTNDYTVKSILIKFGIHIAY